MRLLRQKIYALLRWSERYTKTDMVYLSKGYGWLSLGQFFATFSTFALAILFANFFEKDSYGTYKFVLSIVSILSVATLPGINTYVTQAVARGFDKTYTQGLGTKIRWGLLGSAASLVIATYYFIQGNFILGAAFALSAPFIAVLDSFSLNNTYLQAKKLFSISIGQFVATQIVSFSALAAAAVLTENVLIVLAAYFVPLTFMRILFYFRTVRQHPPKGAADTSTNSYGFHLTLIGLPSRIASYIDSILLFHFLGPVMVAAYAFALAPVEQIRGSFKNITALAVPKMANRSFKEINAVLAKRVALLFVVGACIAGAYILIAPFLFNLFFPKYSESVPITQLLAGLVVFQLPTAFFTSATKSKLSHVPKSWLYWGIMPPAALILSAFFLVPLYGVYGAIASKYIAIVPGALIGVIQWRLLVKRSALKLEKTQ